MAPPRSPMLPFGFGGGNISASTFSSSSWRPSIDSGTASSRSPVIVKKRALS
jgi:hypothetical protein